MWWAGKLAFRMEKLLSLLKHLIFLLRQPHTQEILIMLAHTPLSYQLILVLLYTISVIDKLLERSNLEFKHFCQDFDPIKAYLKKINAKKLGTVQQKDYYFNLPQNDNSTKLKLRIVKNHHQLIYYQRTFSSSEPTLSDLIIVKVPKLTLKLLKKALCVKAVVEKQRQQWQKQNATFNLDKVKNVGQILELEIEVKNKAKDQKTFTKYQQDLHPLLGSEAKPNLELVLENKNN